MGTGCPQVHALFAECPITLKSPFFFYCIERKYYNKKLYKSEFRREFPTKILHWLPRSARIICGMPNNVHITLFLLLNRTEILRQKFYKSEFWREFPIKIRRQTDSSKMSKWTVDGVVIYDSDKMADSYLKWRDISQQMWPGSDTAACRQYVLTEILHSAENV